MRSACRCRATRDRASRVWIAIAAAGEEELQAGYRRFRLTEQTVLTYGEQGHEAPRTAGSHATGAAGLADALPARLVGIPLAEVTWEHEGPALTSYIPPWLQVERDSPLGEAIGHIIQRLRDKAQHFVQRINNPQPGISELVIDEFKFYVACLTSELPLLETLLASNQAHPWVLFNVLALIAGRVAALGGERIPPLFRPYVHTELLASFDQLRRYILRMVTESAIETYLRVPFRLEGGIFKLDLKASWRGSTAYSGCASQAIGDAKRPPRMDRKCTYWYRKSPAELETAPRFRRSPTGGRTNSRGRGCSRHAPLRNYTR